MMKPFAEARITINGQSATIAESMTIRVAIENFAAQLASEGLGDDEHGKRMVEGYTAAINEIRRKIGY